MAQLSIQYPGALEQIYGPTSMAPAMMAGEQFATQQANNDINQKQALQDLYREQQILPLDLQEKQLANTHQGIVNQGAQQAQNINDATFDNRKGLAVKQSGNALSNEDLNQMELVASHMNTAASIYAKTGKLPPGTPQEWSSMSPDQLSSLSQDLITRSKEYRMELLKQEMETKRSLGVANTTGYWHNKTAREVEDLQFKHGKYLKSFMLSMDQKILNEHDPLKRVTMLKDYAQILSEQGDPDSQAKAAEYSRRADNLTQQVNARTPALSAKPGTLDFNQFGLETNPNLYPGAGGNPEAFVPRPTSPNRQVVRTGKDSQGRKVVQYSDGTIEHAD